VTWPGNVIWITPPKAQFNFEDSLSAGLPPIITVGAPGAHGPAATGVHGIGVIAPRAAAVAAATAGFNIELHWPNIGMFMNGTWSMIVAAGVCVSTWPAGRTVSGLGEVPKLHIIIAVEQTCVPINVLPSAGPPPVSGTAPAVPHRLAGQRVAPVFRCLAHAAVGIERGREAVQRARGVRLLPRDASLFVEKHGLAVDLSRAIRQLHRGHAGCVHDRLAIEYSGPEGRLLRHHTVRGVHRRLAVERAVVECRLHHGPAVGLARQIRSVQTAVLHVKARGDAPLVIGGDELGRFGGHAMRDLS
jgi:hypothetical protein